MCQQNKTNSHYSDLKKGKPVALSKKTQIQQQDYYIVDAKGY